MRPVRQTKQAAKKYPTQTQIHDCHQDKPSTIIEDEIIHVFYRIVMKQCIMISQVPYGAVGKKPTMFNESAIQKAMKFSHVH